MTIQAEDTMLADEGLIDLTARLRQARDAKAQWEKLEKDLRAQILQLVDTHDVALTAAGVPVVRVRRSTRHGVDSKKLRALWPEVYDEVETETEVVRLDLP